MSETMSGPATRQNVVDAADVFAATSSVEPEPIRLPTYEARLLISTAEGETVISVTAFGSSRIVDQIMHGASDAFREEVER